MQHVSSLPKIDPYSQHRPPWIDECAGLPERRTVEIVSGQTLLCRVIEHVEYVHQQFKANAVAWSFFSSQAPWYQRTATHWVISAKREETKEKRLLTLIADSAAGRRIKHLIPPKAKSKT